MLSSKEIHRHVSMLCQLGDRYGRNNVIDKNDYEEPHTWLLAIAIAVSSTAADFFEDKDIFLDDITFDTVRLKYLERISGRVSMLQLIPPGSKMPDWWINHVLYVARRANVDMIRRTVILT